ncbi:MAG: response regulator [Betaproteobacteria bacterium]
MRVAMLEDDSSGALPASRRSPGVSLRSRRGIVDAFDKQVFDVLPLDWEVPDMSGIEVLHSVPSKFRSSVPAMTVTSRTSEDDIVHGLRQGADDYVGKPYRHAELIARSPSRRWVAGSAGRNWRYIRRLRRSAHLPRRAVLVPSTKDFDWAFSFCATSADCYPADKYS